MPTPLTPKFHTKPLSSFHHLITLYQFHLLKLSNSFFINSSTLHTTLNPNLPDFLTLLSPQPSTSYPQSPPHSKPYIRRYNPTLDHFSLPSTVYPTHSFKVRPCSITPPQPPSLFFSRLPPDLSILNRRNCTYKTNNPNRYSSYNATIHKPPNHLLLLQTIASVNSSFYRYRQLSSANP